MRQQVQPKSREEKLQRQIMARIRALVRTGKCEWWPCIDNGCALVDVGSDPRVGEGFVHAVVDGDGTVTVGDSFVCISTALRDEARRHITDKQNEERHKHLESALESLPEAGP